MNVNGPFLTALIAGFCFGVWPILARFGGAGPAWFSFWVALGTMFATIPGLKYAEGSPSKGALIVIAAGAVNGIGMVFFGKLATWKDEDVSRLLPMVFVFMTVFTVLSALVFLHEPLTAKKAVGVALACLTIWCLN